MGGPKSFNSLIMLFGSFYVNLTDLRNAKMAGKTLLLGVSVGVFLEEISI